MRQRHEHVDDHGPDHIDRQHQDEQLKRCDAFLHVGLDGVYPQASIARRSGHGFTWIIGCLKHPARLIISPGKIRMFHVAFLGVG